MGLKFTVNGRSVPANQFGREMEKAVRAEAEKAVQSIRADIRQQMASTRCSIHHKTPTSVVQRGDKLVAQGLCCDELQRAVLAVAQ